MEKPEYTEYEAETDTHLARAVHQRVEEKVRGEVRKGNTPTEQQVESWIDEEWRKAQQAIKYWEELRKRQRETINSLNIGVRVLRRVRDDQPAIPKTLTMSSYGKDWNTVLREKK